jgi:hypothetical protein
LHKNSSVLTEAFRNVLEFLFQRQLVEAFPERELSVHALLRYSKVLDVEEAFFADCRDKYVRLLLLPLRRADDAQVDRNQLCPV